MEALARVPRHEFVRAGDETAAYVNRPLGIGHGQTISQPYIVAVMTDFLDLGPCVRMARSGNPPDRQSRCLLALEDRARTERVAGMQRQRVVENVQHTGHCWRHLSHYA